MKKSKRVFENPITSVLGCALIIGSIGLVYIGKTTITETAGWMALGGTFLRAKDSLVGVKGLGE